MTAAGAGEGAEPPLNRAPHGACLRFALRGQNMEARGKNRRVKKSLYNGCVCVKERKLMGNFASEKIFEKILLRKEDFCIFRCIL